MLCKEYVEKIKEEFLPNDRWDTVRDDLKSVKSNREKYTLVIGAGVTAGIVGQWNQLLNEVALSRVADDNMMPGMESIRPDELRSFINRKLKGVFLPEATDVLEKGDYLQFDPEDHLESFDSEGDNSDWLRERVFAQRVWSAIWHLMHIQLGKREYVQDYLDWCNEKEISLFNLNRRKMNNEEKIKEKIETKNHFELIAGINEWAGETLDETKLSDVLTKKDRESLRKMMPDKVPDETLDKVVEDVEDGKSVSEVLHELLVETAKKVLWLPDYCTLDALLDLSLKGSFQSIITYNFDTVFDRLLANENVQRQHGILPDKQYKVEVYGIHGLEPELVLPEQMSKSRKKIIKIYHVHGIMDTPEKSEEWFKIKAKPIIFSGKSYESYQDYRFNLGSMRIASAWHEGSLLCVGFSGSDANFRSIVREFVRTKKSIISEKKASIISGRPRKEHNIFITRGLESDRKAYQLVDGAAEDDLQVSYYCLRSYMNMLKDYFEVKIKAHIIWDETFNDMATSLKNLKA